MKPPIITLSAVWTKLRVLMLPSMDVGVGVAEGVAVGMGVGLGRWRRINHRDGAYHGAASTVRSAVVRKRPGTIEGASEGRSLVTNSRIPDAVRLPRGA